MPTRDTPFPIRGFLGINRRDGADLVADNEFYTLQNWYQKTRGLFYKRSGTTAYISQADVPFEDRIIAFQRQYGILGDAYTLLYCETAQVFITAPSVAPTLVDTAPGAVTGDIFDGGATAAVNVYYSWVGRGYETGISPVKAITPASTNNYITVTVPAFPSGVVSANIFLEAVNGFTMVGVIRTTGGNYVIKNYNGPVAAASDTSGVLTAAVTADGTGSLLKGTYYVAIAWVTGGSTVNQLTAGAPSSPIVANQYEILNIPEDNSKFTVQSVLAAAASTNGATWAHVFIGLKPPGEMPMTWVGMVRSKAGATADNDQNTLTVTSLPYNTNAMTIPMNRLVAGTPTIGFWNGNTFFDGVNGFGGAANSVVRRNDDGTFRYLYWPRTATTIHTGYGEIDPLTAAATVTATGQLIGSRANFIYRAYLSGSGYFTTLNGIAFLANAQNLLLQTDGYSISELVEKFGTVQPGFASQIATFKNQLVMAVTRSQTVLPSLNGRNTNQLYGSNAFQPNNWSDGGTGTALRFATMGDPFGDGVSSIGLFSFTSATDGPQSYVLSMKKSSTYLINNVPNSTSGVPASMQTLSGRVGCLAPGSVVQTPIGTIFLGQDCDVYLVNSTSGEPKRIGTKIQPLLEHLIGSDVLMKKVTAVYHDNHYKLSYASALISDYNDAQLWADLRIDQGLPIAWSGPHSGISLGPQAVFTGLGDTGERYGVRPGAFGLVKLDDTSTFQDLGTTISSVMQWKNSRFNSAAHRKRFMSMALDLYFDSSFTHSILVEGIAEENYGSSTIALSSGAGTWNSSNWDGAAWGSAIFQLVNAWFSPTNLIGRDLYWKLTHSNNAQIILAEVLIMYQSERRRIV